MEPRRLLPTLVIEVFQAERSAAEHAGIEAARLGDMPPGRAMRAVAQHAKRSLDELRIVANRPNLPSGALGLGMGRMLSMVRDRAVDLFMTREMSYRATLLGLHHSVEATELLLHAAGYEADADLREWCAAVLEKRRPLVAEVQAQLGWFGAHPSVAMEPSRATLAAKTMRVLRSGAAAIGLRAPHR